MDGTFDYIEVENDRRIDERKERLLHLVFAQCMPDDLEDAIAKVRHIENELFT